MLESSAGALGGQRGQRQRVLAWSSRSKMIKEVGWSWRTRLYSQGVPGKWEEEGSGQWWPFRQVTRERVTCKGWENMGRPGCTRHPWQWAAGGGWGACHKRTAFRCCQEPLSNMLWVWIHTWVIQPSIPSNYIVIILPHYTIICWFLLNCKNNLCSSWKATWCRCILENTLSNVRLKSRCTQPVAFARSLSEVHFGFTCHVPSSCLPLVCLSKL